MGRGFVDSCDNPSLEKRMRALVLVLALSLVPQVFAGGLADVELYDRTTHTTLPIHRHRGHLYVAGEPGHQYEIRVRNESGQRLLAVTSVDGVNVITGETASEQQSGYVLNSYESVEIEGWRKNLDQVATFFFTSLPNSYAARTGRPTDVGVIGVALFRERERCCRYDGLSRDSASAPSEAKERAESVAPHAQSKLGTGHGHRENSAAQYVDFNRASNVPDQTIVIYYDSKRNLIAQGVVPHKQRAYAHRAPRPFPDGFAPDP
jgi:hypothetical protein